ncbi:MAG: hypothetical protein B6I26_07420 [Desulfobacteraceae bacterium 4572_130]|nr:MAG: hypothetical protein B6I26_07420 [Desulfobacteraceae bacterium 4572_130]
MKEQRIPPLLISDDDDKIWLVTYADLMTLILVFFVFLFSVSSFTQENYKSAIVKIKTQIESETSLTGLMELMEIPESAAKKITIEKITGMHASEQTILDDINKFIRSQNQDKNIAPYKLNGKIIVRVNGKALFDSGSIDIKSEATSILDEIVKLILGYPEYNVNIKGHTDNMPISSGSYPSNWELSALRATSVLKFLVEKGIRPQRLTATGYGEVMPLVLNISEKNRAINRRVEFVLEKK